MVNPVEKKNNPSAISKDVTLPDGVVEQIVLKKVYTDLDCASKLFEHYDRRFFDENSRVGDVVKVLLSFYSSYTKMPSRAVLEALLSKRAGDLKVDLKTLTSTFDSSLELDISGDETFIKDKFIEFIKNKTMYYAIMDSLDDIEKSKDVACVIDKMNKVMTISMDKSLGFEYFKDLERHLNVLANPEAKILTKLTDLDNVTNGGFWKTGKCLVTFLAQPGLGKSMFMSNLAVNYLAQDLKVAIITLEMSEDVYGQRIDALLSGNDINSIQVQIPKVREKILSFKDFHKNAELFIKEYPPNTIACKHIKSYIDKLVAMDKKPDVIIVDYINLLCPNTKSNNMSMYEKVGDVTRDLRALSYIFGVPVISASQVGRMGYDTAEVSMADVSESAGINHTSDFIGALFQQEGDAEAGRICMKVLKNRFGGKIGKVLEFFINYSNLKVTDLEEKREETAKSAVDSVFDGLGSI